MYKNPLDELISQQEALSVEHQKESTAATVARLAALSPLEYEMLRESEAQRLGVRVGVLDKQISAQQKITDEETSKGVSFPPVAIWPEVVDANELLHDISKTIRRFIVCSNDTTIAATLWIAFSWFIDCVQVAPLAAITAPERRCGKSNLLALLSHLCYRPLVASNILPAAVYRVIEGYSPTLLIDEADTFMRTNEELRGVINSGHTRQSAYVIRCVGEDHEPRQFSTWGAKALAGIGHLPDTIMDRSIVLELRRKLPCESAERLRHAKPETFKTLSSKLARLAIDGKDTIKNARPESVDQLNDRAQDNWEPLFAIADYAGEGWPELARQAALNISGEESSNSSLSTELLADIKEIFDHKQVDRIGSTELLELLNGDENKIWVTFNKGNKLTAKQLAQQLREYGIKSRDKKIGYQKVNKGYQLTDFSDAFKRYLTTTTTLTGFPLPATND